MAKAKSISKIFNDAVKNVAPTIAVSTDAQIEALRRQREILKLQQHITMVKEEAEKKIGQLRQAIIACENGFGEFLTKLVADMQIDATVYGFDVERLQFVLRSQQVLPSNDGKQDAKNADAENSSPTP